MIQEANDPSLDDIDQEDRIFQKSKLIQRSPIKKDSTSEMKRISKKLREMRLEKAKGFQECNEKK